MAASGGGAARLARLYFLYGHPLLKGDERIINHKLAEAVKLGAKEPLDIRWGELRKTEGNRVAADLIISEGSVTVKYDVYLRKFILLEFQSTDRGRVELATRLLRLMGINAEVKKVGDKDMWYVIATTNRLAAGREELRKAIAEIVKKAVENGWVDADKAERWLKKLEEGRVLMEGWPEHHVGLVEGALVVRFASTNPDSIEQEAQRFRDMGLEEGRHFSVKMPEGGRDGYVYIRREGLERAAWLSVHGSGEQQRLATKFVEYILRRAEKMGNEVYEKVKEIVKEGKARGFLKLEGFEKEVEVDGRRHVVKVIGGEAVEEDRGGRKLLRIKITAEVGRVEGEHTIVDRVRREYTITFGRYKNNKTMGFATARADAPGGREADAERLVAVIKALTGEEPRIRRMKDGTIIIECNRMHLDGFARYAGLADAIEKWLGETKR